jgi:hypothetical protein
VIADPCSQRLALSSIQDLAGRHLSAKVRAFVNFLPVQFGGESPIETLRCLPAGNTRALRLATGGEWRD